MLFQIYEPFSFVTFDGDHVTSSMSTTYNMNHKNGSSNFCVSRNPVTLMRFQESHGVRVIDLTLLSGDHECQSTPSWIFNYKTFSRSAAVRRPDMQRLRHQAVTYG